MAPTVSPLPRREDTLPPSLGTLTNGIVRQAFLRRQARLEEESRLWAGYCDNGLEWLLANTEPC